MKWHAPFREGTKLTGPISRQALSTFKNLTKCTALNLTNLSHGRSTYMIKVSARHVLMIPTENSYSRE